MVFVPHRGGGKQTTFSTSHRLDAKTAKKLSGDNIRQHFFGIWAKVVQTTCFGDFGSKMLSGDNIFYMTICQKFIDVFFDSKADESLFVLKSSIFICCFVDLLISSNISVFSTSIEFTYETIQRAI